MTSQSYPPLRRRERDEHLFGSGPKRILAIDGGGVRGLIAIQFLKRMEEILRVRFGNDEGFRLCDYFDLFAGTSTGAILAAALAVGKSANELETLYLELAPKVFGGTFTHMLQPLSARFNPRQLLLLLYRELGSIDLDAPEIASGLAIVAKRVDTDSAWVLTNNPRNPFWDDLQDGAGVTVGAKHYPLALVVRASTAAPYYFPPQEIMVRQAPAEPAARNAVGLFLDGGLTAHNNPSLMALMVARLKAHGLEWAPGPENLLMISVGTGTWRNVVEAARFEKVVAAWAAVTSLRGLIAECERSTLTTMQWLSVSPRPKRINSEIGNLESDLLAPAPLCTFQRYDVELTAECLSGPGIDLNVDERRIDLLRDMTCVNELQLMRELGTRAAKHEVVAADFPPVFDVFR